MIQTRIKPALPLQAVNAFDMASVEAQQIADVAQIASEMFHRFRHSLTRSGRVDAEASDWNQIATLLSVIEDKAMALGKACDSDTLSAMIEAV